jgi:outer membrane biosynthesis protein TonB
LLLYGNAKSENSVLLDKLESGLLAYETEQGLFHAQASGWQRFHLLWTFRNFNSLPVKLLKAREQRLVESLYRTKLIHLPNHPGQDLVIGTVEHYKPTPVLDAITAKNDLPAAIAPPLETKNKREMKRSPKPHTISSNKVGRVKRYFVFAGGAVCALIAILGWDHIQARPASAAAIAPRVELLQQTSSAEDVATPAQPQSATTQSTGNDVQPLPSAQVAVPAVPQVPAAAVASDEASKESQMPAVGQGQSSAIPVETVARAANDPEAHKRTIERKIAESVADTEPDSLSRIQVSRSPARIVYPIYPPTNVKGKVALKAFLSAEGTVSGVKILSGDHILADAAARAVRRWHYAPYYQDGKPVETETNVSVSFIAPDAIVISFPSTLSLAR